MGQSTSVPSPATASSQCPMHQQRPDPSPSSSLAQCPIAHDTKPNDEQVSSSSRLAECPIAHKQDKPWSDTLDPLNQMPSLSQTPATAQSIALPTERTSSSIPREGDKVWDYPSPQQFYNALVRKGWETPEEHVEVMVEIHTFLNEQAWNEVLKWEQRHARFACATLLICVQSY